MTQALFRPNVSHDYDNGLADLLDVVGQNYRENEILAAHEQKPTRKISAPRITHDREVWLALRDNPAYAGQFLWAGIDYLGESRAWPHDRRLLRPAGSHRRNQAHGLRARRVGGAQKPMVHITRRVPAREVPPTDPGYEADSPHRADAVRRLDPRQRGAARRERGGVQQLRKRWNCC